MSGVAVLADRAVWPELAALLGRWLPLQRWFQGKARVVTDLRVDDVAVLPGDPPVADVFLRVFYRRGAPERYQVPLVKGAGLGAVGGVPIADALAAADPARTVARRALDANAINTVLGAAVHGAPVGAAPALAAEARALGVEQSNTSVVFGDEVLLKVLRRLEAGMNPEVELTRGLTEAGFEHVPPQAGALLLDGAEGPCALAVLTAFRSGARDAWAVACAEAAAARRGEFPAPLDGQADALGRVVGELHLALRRRFGGRQATRADVEAWVRDMHQQLDSVLLTLGERAQDGAAVLPAWAAGAVRARIDRLRELADAGAVIRHHGDLHLGQVLLDATHGWQILDFEGEPARPLAERRAAHSPIRDVAGMLRSFDYAAAHGAPGDEVAPPAGVTRWHEEGRSAFLHGYLATCERHGLLPRNAEAQQALLEAFELDKAVYELGYELANRPTWVRIPIGGILRLIEHGTVPSPTDR